MPVAIGTVGGSSPHSSSRRTGLPSRSLWRANDCMMHDDEVHVAPHLVSRLIAGQFPDWAGLPVDPIRSAGTDNAIYRLGGDLVVRLPLRPAAAEQVEKEGRWLP